MEVACIYVFTKSSLWGFKIYGEISVCVKQNIIFYWKIHEQLRISQAAPSVLIYILISPPLTRYG